MIHKQAAKNTAMLLAAGLMSVLGVYVIVQFMTPEILIYLVCASAFVYLIYIFYSIEKNRLETLDRLKKM